MSRDPRGPDPSGSTPLKVRPGGRALGNDPEDETSVLLLPDDVLLGILFFLFPDALSFTGATCRRLHGLAAADPLWRRHLQLHLGPGAVDGSGSLAALYRGQVQSEQCFPMKQPIPVQVLPPGLLCLRDVLRTVDPDTPTLDAEAVLEKVNLTLQAEGAQYDQQFAEAQTQLVYHLMTYRCILQSKVRELKECAQQGRHYDGWRGFVSPPQFTATALQLFTTVLGPWRGVPELRTACLQEFSAVQPLLRRLEAAMASEYARRRIGVVFQRCREGLGFGPPPDVFTD